MKKGESISETERCSDEYNGPEDFCRAEPGFGLMRRVFRERRAESCEIFANPV